MWICIFMSKVWREELENCTSHMAVFVFCFLFFFAACLKHGISGRTAVIKIDTAADMNTSVEFSYPEEGLLGNSTWAYSFYHQNYTVSPPLLSDKTSTSKPKACEQLHIALEVWKACMLLNTKRKGSYFRNAKTGLRRINNRRITLRATVVMVSGSFDVINRITTM